jgi:hypothetical protein
MRPGRTAGFFGVYPDPVCVRAEKLKAIQGPDISNVFFVFQIGFICYKRLKLRRRDFSERGFKANLKKGN